MRRATDYLEFQRLLQAISIHALHEESDSAAPDPADGERIISIHALHEESDP